MAWIGTAWADPLDAGEGYALRGGPPDWMDSVDFGWLIVDYGLFALTVGLLGWLMFAHPARALRWRDALAMPWRALFRAAEALPFGLRELAQGLAVAAALLAVAAWVFFCQWLSSMHLGALAMAGLAMLAVFLVSLMRDGGKPARRKPDGS